MEGKAWEIWSCVVTSGKQRVGSARLRISKTLSWNAHPRAGGLNIHKAADQYHLWFSMLGMGWCRTGIIMVGNHPLSFHLTSLDLPGLPHTANDQRLGKEMAWGRKLGWLCADRRLDKNILSVGSTTSTYSVPKPLIVSNSCHTCMHSDLWLSLHFRLPPLGWTEPGNTGDNNVHGCC